MGNIVDRSHGADYHQPEKPTDVSQGKLWFNPETDLYSMADGVDYWGQVELGVAGYSAGGYDGAARLSVVDKLIFADESISSITSTLNSGTSSLGATASLSDGYILGGLDPSLRTDVVKLDFSDDSTSLLVSGLTTARYALQGVHSTDNGYLCGGRSSVTETSIIDKLVFSTDSIASIATTLPQTERAGTKNNSSTSGYICGGIISAAVSYSSQYSRIRFSDENVANLTSTLNQLKYATYGGSSQTKGYVFAGINNIPVYISDIDRLEFSSESHALLSVTFANHKYGATSNSALGAYLMGGEYPNSTRLSSVDRFTFPTESIDSVASTLSGTTNTQAGFENLS